MTKATHTSGPWNLERETEREIDRRGNTVIVETCDSWKISVEPDHPNGALRLATIPNRDSQDAANAALIASAPELLAALEQMLKEHDIITDNDPSVRRGDDRWPNSAKKARDAIAKARGQ